MSCKSKLDMSPQERQAQRQKKTLEKLKSQAFLDLFFAAEEVQNVMCCVNVIERSVMRKLSKAITKARGVI